MYFKDKGKKMIRLLCILCLAFQLEVFALLPPFYEGAREIEAILAAPDLSDFSGEQILRITKIEGGYEIETTSHLIQVQVQILHSNKIGPAEFQLIFSDPIKK